MSESVFTSFSVGLRRQFVDIEVNKRRIGSDEVVEREYITMIKDIGHLTCLIRI